LPFLPEISKVDGAPPLVPAEPAANPSACPCRDLASDCQAQDAPGASAPQLAGHLTPCRAIGSPRVTAIWQEFWSPGVSASWAGSRRPRAVYGSDCPKIVPPPASATGGSRPASPMSGWCR